jgi:hypothetical protein
MFWLSSAEWDMPVIGGSSPDRLGWRMTTARPAGRSERVTAARRVAADQDRAAMAVLVGDLLQGPVEDGDVIGGGVRSGIARAQLPGQGFAGAVEEAEQGVVAERITVD